MCTGGRWLHDTHGRKRRHVVCILRECMYVQEKTVAGHGTDSRNPFSIPFTHSWHGAGNKLAPQPYRSVLYVNVCSDEGYTPGMQ